MRIHLVYPEQLGNLAAPWCIGNRLHAAFGAWDPCVEVVGHAWERPALASCDAGDIVVGHPYPYGRGAFLELARESRRAVALFPWAQCDAHDEDMTPWIDSWASTVEMLPICGPYWRKLLPARWNAGALDLAIDPHDFPALPPGPKHQMLHVGCALPAKGTRYLHEVSRLCTNAVFGAVGDQLPGFTNHGFIPLQGQPGRNIVRRYGCFIATGTHDANPMTMLEAVALGRLAICTPTSGWGEDVCLHIPGDDPVAAARRLDEVATMPYEQYDALRAKQRKALESYTWKRFTDAVLLVALGESR